MLEYISISILKLLYPIKEPNLSRDRPLQVLALGLGRTGTDSLRNALYELGYKEIHHGFRVAMAPGEAVQWCRLAKAKFFSRDQGYLTRPQFDKVLGDCEGVTDLASAAFAVELLRAYPEAKVVLNRRRDLEEWHASQSKTIDRLYRTWPEWTRQWIESKTFWLSRVT